MVLAACVRQPEETHDFYSEVRSVDRLVLAQMTISKMATVDDLRLEDARGPRQTAEAVLDAMKIGKRKAAYSYDTYLRAYIDLSRLQPGDVVTDDVARTVTLTLPAVQTEFAGRDASIREDHYRVTGLRSAIDARERADIKERMNAPLRREVETRPVFRDRLTAQAKAKAETYFTSLLGGEGYTVIVRFKDR